MATPITPATLNGAFQNFNTRFEMGRTAAGVWWPRIAMEVPSGTEEEIYEWMHMVPSVRKWVGPRRVNRLATNGYRLKNDKWEETIGVARTKIEDDKLGFYAPRFEMMGLAVAKWPDQQLAKLLKNGATDLCWDGKAFFADDHPIDPNDADAGSIDNKFALALTSANFDTVYSKMQEYKSEAGEPMGLVPDTMFIPPALRAAAQKITKSEIIPSAAGTASESNYNKGIVDVVVLPELAGEDTAWYLAVTKLPVKPLIFQKREMGGLVSRTAEDSPNVFELDEYQYGVRLRAAFGYGLPYLIARSVG